MISSIVGTVNSYSTVYSADKTFSLFFFFALGCSLLLLFVVDCALLGVVPSLSPNVISYLAMCQYSLVLRLFSCLSILQATENWKGPGNEANNYIFAALLTVLTQNISSSCN